MTNPNDSTPPRFGTWTPVTEALPPDTDGFEVDILVTVYGFVCPAVYTRCRDDIDWRSPEYGIAFEKVSHWMLYPSPPSNGDASQS